MKCSEANKFNNLCEGFQVSEIDDEPCEQCKNCIKCVDGYFQNGEIPEELKPEDVR